MTPEAIESAAVKAIERFCLENPKCRLSQRQKHVLKQHVKSIIPRFDGYYKAPSLIPYEKLTVPNLVQLVKSRPLDNN